MRQLLHDVEESVPRQVEGDPFGGFEGEADRVEWVDHLYAVAADVLVEAILIDCVGQVDRGLFVAASDHDERILDPEVGVVAQAGHEEDVAGAVVGVEVAPVVEVAVRAARPCNRLGQLMNRILVEWSQHQISSSSSRCSSGRW